MQKIINEEIVMSEKEMNSYRFSSGIEPSDEMLKQLMKEVAEEAKESNDKAMIDFFKSLKHEARSIRKECSNNQSFSING